MDLFRDSRDRLTFSEDEVYTAVYPRHADGGHQCVQTQFSNQQPVDESESQSKPQRNEQGKIRLNTVINHEHPGEDSAQRSHFTHRQIKFADEKQKRLRNTDHSHEREVPHQRQKIVAIQEVRRCQGSQDNHADEHKGNDKEGTPPKGVEYSDRPGSYGNIVRLFR